MWRLKEYIRTDGSNPYRIWFDRLDVQAAAKIATATYRMAQGNLSNVKWFRGIGEWIIDWGPGHRIYLAKDGESFVILLDGWTKRTQPADIERAKTLWAEYKTRKTKAAGAPKPTRGSGHKKD